MKKSKQILENIEQRVEQPFITAKFGDKWKEHTKAMLEDGQIDIDSIINIAWKQGRRALLLEDSLIRLVDIG